MQTLKKKGKPLRKRECVRAEDIFAFKIFCESLEQNKICKKEKRKVYPVEVIITYMAF